ncbi:MAG TPA: hypothetical protein VNX65_02620 [Patescibacteria group bacterium]|jgi:hypothetical protein|nr:hypothetical protein [Patescibacteria group bacterium]
MNNRQREIATSFLVPGEENPERWSDEAIKTKEEIIEGLGKRGLKAVLSKLLMSRDLGALVKDRVLETKHTGGWEGSDGDRGEQVWQLMNPQHTLNNTEIRSQQTIDPDS